MIELNRIDFRDALVALGLLHHAAGLIGARTDQLSQTAASLAEPKMSELIVGFLKRPNDQRDVRQWGYTVVETNGGPGFVRWEYQAYQPTFALDRIGLALAKLAQQDKYGRIFVTGEQSSKSVAIVRR